MVEHSDVLTWSPAGVVSPLRIDLNEIFPGALGTET